MGVYGFNECTRIDREEVDVVVGATAGNEASPGIICNGNGKV